MSAIQPLSPTQQTSNFKDSKDYKDSIDTKRAAFELAVKKLKTEIESQYGMATIGERPGGKLGNGFSEELFTLLEDNDPSLRSMKFFSGHGMRFNADYYSTHAEKLGKVLQNNTFCNTFLLFLSGMNPEIPTELIQLTLNSGSRVETLFFDFFTVNNRVAVDNKKEESEKEILDDNPTKDRVVRPIFSFVLAKDPKRSFWKLVIMGGNFDIKDAQKASKLLQQNEEHSMKPIIPSSFLEDLAYGLSHETAILNSLIFIMNRIGLNSIKDFCNALQWVIILEDLRT